MLEENRVQKAIRVALFLALTAALLGLGNRMPAQATTAQQWETRQFQAQEENKIDPALVAMLASAQADEMIPVIVTMDSQVDFSKIGGPDREERQRGLIRALQAIADATQRDIRNVLEERMSEGLVSQFVPFWVFNGLSVSAVPTVIDELAARDDVLRITPDEIVIQPDADLMLSVPEENLAVVNAPALWDLGLLGQGIVVASLDTGVDGYHPDLNANWRGGSNSWFDPYGQHPDFPVDLNGHGTWVMGVLVGGDAGGTSIGVAPQAQWIAVKIFNDSGASTATAIHLGYQWLLDPDGNPNTSDAPHVVNNSWTFSNPGCDLEFELDLQALQAADILPVFAAGNGGPNPYTSYSPANNPAAFAVGGIDNYDNLYYFSSRGPSSCGDAESIYPELVAPGIAIHTTERFGLYTNATGTSLSAPHVSGGLALLLSANSELRASEQSAALLDSAVDLGLAGPDSDFGFGRLDLLAAYQSIQGQVLPTATPTPSPTPDLTVNLAIGKSTSVSSFQDSDHTGSQGVDGDLVTYWQSKRAVGKKVSDTEWIKVDLGNQANLSQVVLKWEAYYATAYRLQVSADDVNWVTVFNTNSADGGQDTIDLGQVSARYVLLESTAWNDGSLRAWLREFQIYGIMSAPLPTNTPTATPVLPGPTVTSTPVPTSTPPAGTLIHIGDIDGSAAPGSRNRWQAEVTISVHNADELPVSGALVSGIWSGGASGVGSCVTNAAGVCLMSIADIKSNAGSVTFTITEVVAASATYSATANHDPDGDSDGTNITVVQP